MDTLIKQKEIWKDILGYEGFYKVSNLGRVARVSDMKILKPARNKNGYLSVSLWKNNNGKTKNVHRLVAIAFIENKDNKEQIDHINAIKTDNRVENLRWCSRSENMRNVLTRNFLSKNRTGIKLSYKTKEKIKFSHLGKPHITKNTKKIICVETNTEYQSISEASKKLGINKSHICSVINGLRKSAGKLHWRLA